MTPVTDHDRVDHAEPVRPNLLALTLDELEALVVARGEPSYRARQIFTAIYGSSSPAFATMTALPKRLRGEWSETFSLALPRLDELQKAHDGTRKLRLLGDDGSAFEAVLIPEVARGRRTNTLCVSSQTGCALGCQFCFTASFRRHRDLTTDEIVGQVLATRQSLADEPDMQPTNIVFMGMGEPLLNYDAVVRAVRILTNSAGLDFSTRRVTVSTAGIVPRLAQLGHDLPTQVAISLNATTDAVRDRIMPINRTYPLADLLAALRAFPLARRRRFTIEYVLLDRVNDSDADAARLPTLLAGLPVKVNLLPLNPHARTPFKPPSAERVLAFQDRLRRAGLNTILRKSRGADITAACGQLGADGEDRGSD